MLRNCAGLMVAMVVWCPSFSMGADVRMEDDRDASEPLLLAPEHDSTESDPFQRAEEIRTEFERPMSRPGMGGPMGGGGPPGYQVAWYPSRSLSDRPGDLALVRQSFNVGMPVWRDEGAKMIASFGVRNTLFSTDAVLPDTLRPFPDQLWSVNFGLNYMRPFQNGWTGGLITGIGSASDQPFQSVDQITATIGGYVKIPVRNERDAWTLGLLYFHGGPANFPFPMLAYSWNPSEQFRANLGIPFSVHWTPTEKWTFDASYVPLLNINARATYAFTPTLKGFGGYEYLNESYFLSDEVDANDRFFGLEQRLVLGIRWECCSRASIDAQGGYSFGRRFGVAEGQLDRFRDRVDVDAGAFLGLAFRLIF